MENGTKLRILYLYQYLMQHTDSEHTLSTAELIKALKEEYSIKVSRNTISNDLDMLHDCGLDVEHYESTQNKYYYDGHIYELPELKLLVDAISSSKFITQRKSNELIAKLLTSTNMQNAEKLRRHIYVFGRAKSDNENGYYIVDAINKAIDIKRKIAFYYTDFNVERQRYISNDGKPYIVSPYMLIWDGDYYYVRGFCDECREIRNFRVDRIAEQPNILNQIAEQSPNGCDLDDYNKQVFRMYDTGELSAVQLYCHVSVMKYLIDNFGADFDVKVVDADHFKVTIQVYASATFYRWVFGFNGKIKIIGPEGIVSAYKEMLQRALEET